MTDEPAFNTLRSRAYVFWQITVSATAVLVEVAYRIYASNQSINQLPRIHCILLNSLCLVTISLTLLYWLLS